MAVKKISQKRLAEAGAKLAKYYLDGVYSPDAINGVKDRHLPAVARRAAFRMFCLANGVNRPYYYSDWEAFNIGIDCCANERRVELYNLYDKSPALLVKPVNADTAAF